MGLLAQIFDLINMVEGGRKGHGPNRNEDSSPNRSVRVRIGESARVMCIRPERRESRGEGEEIFKLPRPAPIYYNQWSWVISEGPAI